VSAFAFVEWRAFLFELAVLVAVPDCEALADVEDFAAEDLTDFVLFLVVVSCFAC
jgi:hypothetical protein